MYSHVTHFFLDAISAQVENTEMGGLLRHRFTVRTVKRCLNSPPISAPT